MTEKTSLCEQCVAWEVVIEVRGGKTMEYPSCDFSHRWFRLVKEPKQCRDFSPITEIEND